MIEASEDQDFTDISQGNFSRIGELDLGPDLNHLYPRDEASASRKEILLHGDGVRQAREELVKALVLAEIPVFPIDGAKHTAELQRQFEDNEPVSLTTAETAFEDENEREDRLVSNTVQRTIEFGKSGVLIGMSHADRGNHYHMFGRPDLPIVPTAQAVENAGFRTRTIRFRDIPPTRLLPGVERTEVVELDKFMLRPSSDADNFDLIANVPPTEQQLRLDAIERRAA